MCQLHFYFVKYSNRTQWPKSFAAKFYCAQSVSVRCQETDSCLKHVQSFSCCCLPFINKVPNFRITIPNGNIQYYYFTNNFIFGTEIDIICIKRKKFQICSKTHKMNGNFKEPTKTQSNLIELLVELIHFDYVELFSFFMSQYKNEPWVYSTLHKTS